MGAAALIGFITFTLKSLNSNLITTVSNYPLPRNIQQQVS